VTPNPIDNTFEKLRVEQRKAFIPFVTAGDPDAAGTVELIRALAANGADLIEIGFPYSDPIADGPVIQASYSRALARGLRLNDIFSLVRKAADLLGPAGPPLVAMTSVSLIHARGLATFLDQAKAAGFSGAIVPDLPFDESAELAALARERDFKLIQLVTPTTPLERARAIGRLSSGFLYCVSVTGITGEREAVPDAIVTQLQALRSGTDLPLCVGFGISKPAQVRALREHADGVIVGSALVRLIEQGKDKPFAQTAAAVADLAQALSSALRLPKAL
jgi:tryptophan synthase alpha chain